MSTVVTGRRGRAVIYCSMLLGAEVFVILQNQERAWLVQNENMTKMQIYNAL